MLSWKRRHGAYCLASCALGLGSRHGVSFFRAVRFGRASSSLALLCLCLGEALLCRGSVSYWSSWALRPCWFQLALVATSLF